eukprot:11658351-Karenia_brevis.AAC.1
MERDAHLKDFKSQGLSASAATDVSHASAVLFDATGAPHDEESFSETISALFDQICAHVRTPVLFDSKGYFSARQQDAIAAGHASP